MNEDGVFTDAAGPELQNKAVLEEGTDAGEYCVCCYHKYVFSEKQSAVTFAGNSLILYFQQKQKAKIIFYLYFILPHGLKWSLALFHLLL